MRDSTKVAKPGETLKELPKTILHGSVGQVAGGIENTLRPRDEKSLLRAQIGAEGVQNGKPSILAQDRPESAGRGAHQSDRFAAEDSTVTILPPGPATGRQARFQPHHRVSMAALIFAHRRLATFC